MSTSLRERKKAETRQAIADAALRLAVERGPGAVTVDDIAAAADVSPRTVFNYFPSKEAAILGFDPQRRRDLVARLESRPATETPLEALREAMRSTDPTESVLAWRTRALLAREHPHLNAAYLAGFASLEDDLTAALARRLGLEPDDGYPRLVVTVAVAATRLAFGQAIEVGDPESSSRRVDEAFAALAAGLPAPPPPTTRRRPTAHARRS